MSSRRQQNQTEIRFRSTWGGRRKGAGRKKQKGSGVEHRSRPVHDPRHPVLVTLRVADRVWGLRSKRSFRVIERAFRTGRSRLGIRLTHYTVQGNHLHLIVEADDRTALSRGIQGLSVRLSKGLNRMMGTRGKVFPDRFHASALLNPTQVRRAIRYVLSNAWKHSILPRTVRHDPFAGGRDAQGKLHPTVTGNAPPVVEATTWLIRVGWLRSADTGAG